MQLEINNKKFSFAELANLKRTLNNARLSEYEKKTLEFCEQWLSGKESFIIQTSGSTGIPKQITVTRKQMTTSALLTAQALSLQKGYKAFICLSTEHIAGIMMLVRSFIVGMNITIITPKSNPLEDFNNEINFDFTAIVPLQLTEIFDKSPQKIEILDKMKAIIIGGAEINQFLEKKIQLIKTPVYATYGMTETISHIALKRLNGNEKQEYYQSFPGTIIGQDERGCLTVKSKVTNDRVIITNDIVELIAHDKFFWKGRMDNVINSGGYKIQVEKVEKALELVLYNNNISEKSFVSSKTDHKFGEIIIAAIEGFPIADQLQNKIIKDLSGQLEKYEIPKKIFFIEKFIKTPTGKIDKIATLKNHNII